MKFVFLAGLFLLLNTIDPSVQDQGSTPRIKEIVIGRCYDYQQKKLGSNTTAWKDCYKIWEVFHQAFAYQNPCTLTSDDYKPFFDEVGMEEIPKSMFWSGTFKVVHVYADSGTRFTTLEDTMAGYLVNGLKWCGNQNLSRDTTDGIDYVSCPSCDTSAFWGLASKTFAEHARGIVRVMLNGSRVDSDGNRIPAYNRQSYFARYELPNLQVEKITKLKIIVATTIQGPEFQLQGCKTPSIILAKRDAKKRGIKVSCHDNQYDVRHILCTDYPKARECLFRLRKQIKTSRKER